MVYKKIQLEENDENVFLEVFAANKIGDFKRNAILVIPGGGYRDVCADREGEPIAQAFMPYGYNAFVLHYSVGGKRTYPDQLIQASLAMKHIKDNAEEYNIDPEKVFVVGFSAGGHLAASLGTFWHRQEVYDAIDMPYGYNKPAGMMLIYPVISSGEYSHIASFQNLLGAENPTEEQLRNVSIECHIDEKTAPAYLVHTSNDATVDVRNSLLMGQAFAEKGITFEMHIYPDAPHGAALGNKITECGLKKHVNPCFAKWIENAVLWAEQL